MIWRIAKSLATAPWHIHFSGTFPVGHSREELRFIASLEGESVEVSLITEAQWTVSPHAFVKLNCGFGLSEQSPDVAPEVGVLFHF